MLIEIVQQSNIYCIHCSTYVVNKCNNINHKIHTFKVNVQIANHLYVDNGQGGY